MQVERLGHVAIRVEDMERAKAFYLGLGCRLVWDAADWCYLMAGDDGLALLGPDYRAAGPHFAFHFSDRDQVQAMHDHRDGTASFYLRDPEGNWLEMLYEPTGGVVGNTVGADGRDPG